MTVIAAMVLFHRKRSGLSQLALAQFAGVGKTVVFDIERGKATVRWDTLQKVLTALNIQVNFSSPLMKEFEETHENR